MILTYQDNSIYIPKSFEVTKIQVPEHYRTLKIVHTPTYTKIPYTQFYITKEVHKMPRELRRYFPNFAVFISNSDTKHGLTYRTVFFNNTLWAGGLICWGELEVTEQNFMDVFWLSEFQALALTRNIKPFIIEE